MRCGGLVTVWMLITATACAADGKVAAVDKAPAGLSEKVAAALNPAGQQVSVDGAAVCTVWLAKDLPVKADFKPSLNIKYPFAPGQFLGVLEVQQKSGYTDFRGQDVAAGVYTLRYGQQPVDGNHVGTSDLYDFLLAIPAKADADPAPLKGLEDLFKRSATAAGANHPAIYSLLPAEEKAKAATLEHDEGKELWQLTIIGNAGGKPLPLKVVVVGKSEG
jgi:hypothetical protein